MDTTLKKICELLKNKDHMRRCGAAVVLAELAPKNADVVKALGEALPGAGDQLAGCVLEALQAIGSPAALPYVMPLLNANDMAVRVRAVGIAACAGSAIVPEVKRRLKDAARPQKPALIDLLARLHNRDAMDTLLELLFDADFTIAKDTCDAVRRHLPTAQPPDRLALHKQVAKFLNDSRVKKQERVLVSTLLMLGNIGRPEAAAVLLKYAAPKTGPYIRRHALIALKSVELTGKLGVAVLRKILPYVDDADEEVVRHTLDIMGRLPAQSVPAAKWRSLLKSKHGYARAFAARMFANADTAKDNLLLIGLLRHEDNEVRETAARALAAHAKAPPVLLKALASEKDKDAAWALVRIMKSHAAAIDKKAMKKFAGLAAKELLAGKPRHEPLLGFVRDTDPKAAESILLEAGMKHKQAKRWPQAIDCLRRLLHTETFNDDVSYALSVCDLKASHKELAPQHRAEDHALRGFSALLRRNKGELPGRLTKDKTLDVADLYYVGFHFGESSGDEHAFGTELLKFIAKKWPKSKEAKAVRERMKALQ